MPACLQHTALRACSRPQGLARKSLPPPPAPSLARRAGSAAAARRAVVSPARRYTGRSTGQQQPPADPNRRLRARRRPRERSEVGHESSSEFSAELFVLFGLPALVLVLSYAFNEPRALMISIPILMLIPGIRDVLLIMVTDGIRAARHGWRFVSLDSQDLSDLEYERQRPPPAQQRAEWQEAQAERAARAWRQAQAGQPAPPAPPPVWQPAQQPEWGRRVRPPPPPPPPPEYELQPGEYRVVPAASAVAPAPAPRSPFADGWPEEGAYCDLPHSPFAPDWQAHLGQQQQQQQQQPYWQQQQQYAEQEPYTQQRQQAPLAGTGAWQGEAPAAAAERLAASRRRRASRSRTTAAAAGSAEVQRAAAGSPGQAGRLVRPASKGRVGVDLRGERDAAPLLLRPLLALIPFLRYWGGFL